MRRGIHVAWLSGLLVLSSTATGFAVDTPTPTPQTTSKAKPVKQVLTQAQKDAIAAARLAYSNAKTNAQNGFNRAVADAKAIRDQAIRAAGKDKNALTVARKEYLTSYQTILTAYKADLIDAKAIFQAAIAAVKLQHP